MLRLKDRNKSIPNGFQFYDPNIRWQSRQHMSFRGIVDGIRAARIANPGITKAKNLATEIKAVEDEVDLYNATVCQQNGWTEYYTDGQGGAAVPFSPPAPRTPRRGLISRAKNVVAGSSILVEGIRSREDAVSQEQANSRAATCATCPLNGKKDWLAYFTQPASDAIRQRISEKIEMKLETPYDSQLGVCEACDCPMSLKVWFKFEAFWPKMTQAAKDALDKGCWIRSGSVRI